MSMTPMMKQYLEIKEKYKDCVLFYRLGDFYEMFFEDAIQISAELDLTLTGRDCGLDKRAPMCGIPYHAAETYIKKLIDKNYKVAICEQLTEAQKGKMVERDVVKIITPGTVFSENMLDEKSNNYIAAVFSQNDRAAVAWADVSTGSFFVTEVNQENLNGNLNRSLITINPAEIICNSEAFSLTDTLPAIKQKELPDFVINNSFSYKLNDAKEIILKQFKIADLKVFDLAGKEAKQLAIASLLNYLNHTQKAFLAHINKIETINQSFYLELDSSARKNLELTESFRGSKKYGSLLWVLDQTKCSMGARLLKQWVEQPLRDKVKIQKRLDAVEELTKSIITLDRIRDVIGSIYDIERLVSKLSGGNFTPRDAIGLKLSLQKLPEFLDTLKPYNATLLTEAKSMVGSFSDVINLLDGAILEDAGVNMKEGGFIKPSFHPKLQEYNLALTEGKKWLAALESNEREKTGIKTLRVGFNNVFGYYIEITNSQKHLAPYSYVRKQTIANAERFITEELKTLESKILNAEDNAIKLENQLFEQIKTELLKFIDTFKSTAYAVALTDVLTSLAKTAMLNHYKKPKINTNNKIEIKNGRHPVVEKVLKSNTFTPNDTLLDKDENMIILLTGPNMSGKSTYMRQVALIIILAHIGSFVPADIADIALTDRIFTRIGASDDLSSGQSTFMVEMVEVANIINQATENSLIILDEVGRGTSTFDGISIAHAVIEYISKNIKAKTLFATHYHELIALEDVLPNLKNYSVAVKEFEDRVLFLHKIVRGGTSRSFGIEVARLSGICEEVLKQSKVNLSLLESGKPLSILSNSNKTNIKPNQNLKSSIENDVLNTLKNININDLSPLMCMDLLNQLKNKLK